MLAPYVGTKSAGTPNMTAAENIAGGANSPEAAMAQWMGSLAHRANLLNADYRELGVSDVRVAKKVRAAASAAG